MTKKELIEALKDYPDDTEIFKEDECFKLIDILYGEVSIDKQEPKSSIYLVFDEYE